MKIAIIGAGNAGCITALHYQKYISEQSNKLYHEYFEEEQWLKHFKKENKLG